MEPETVQSFVLAAWPFWLVLAAVWVAWYVESPASEEEVPCGCSFGQRCGFCSGCCLEERLQREAKYHGDDSFGR